MNEFDIGQVAFKVVANAQIEVYICRLLIISYSTVVRAQTWESHTCWWPHQDLRSCHSSAKEVSPDLANQRDYLQQSPDQRLLGLPAQPTPTMYMSQKGTKTPSKAVLRVPPLDILSFQPSLSSFSLLYPEELQSAG